MYEAAELVAIGRGAVVGGGRRLHLGLVEVVPEHRRRGLAREVTAALAAWAAQLGAREAFLQVEERNAAAIALYGAMGLSTHHSYLTREARPAALERLSARVGAHAAAGRPGLAAPACRGWPPRASRASSLER